MRVRRRLIGAIPPASSAIAGALLWGCGMALSLYAGLEIAIEGRTAHRGALLVLYFAGGLLSYPLALYVVRFAAYDKRAEIRFCAAFVSLCAATIGGTALLSALLFGNTDGLSIFAGVAALYQFAVMGTRYYLPLGVVLLFAASFWLVRTTR